MSESAFWTLWTFSGVLGGVMFWRADKGMLRRDQTWCPTPRAILFMLLGGFVLGVILFLAAGVAWIMVIAETRPPLDNWFTRPICKKKDTV